jgi:hypothetical protein
MKSVGKPDAGNPHVRFDERGRETGRCQTAQATAPFLDSTASDFVLVVTAKSMDDYEGFTQRFLHENPDIKSFKTHVVMDRVKSGFALPVEEPLDNVEGRQFRSQDGSAGGNQQDFS